MLGISQRTAIRCTATWIAGISLLLGLSLATGASAYDLSRGELDLAFDSTFSFGVQLRTESVDKKNYCTTIGGPNALDPGNTVPDGAGDGPGENGDCGKSAGNLNYDKGAPTSTILKGIHELDGQWRNYSGLVRFQWWYDGINQAGDRARTPLNDDAEWPDGPGLYRVGAGVELLDAYLQGNWYPGNIPVTLKVGNQVVSWGESTFIQNGINAINPIDVTKLRVPGAELREALVPLPMAWGSVSPNEYLSLEGFYQFYWRPTTIDQPGTFFSTHDALGPGGEWFDISLGHHDCDISPYAGSPNPEALFGLRQDGSIGATCIERGQNVEAGNQGQGGIAARLFVPQLAGTEFGLFFFNYHNRLPIVSGSFQETFLEAGIRLFGGAFDPVNNPLMAGAAVGEVITGTRANQFYPEDVQKIGASFSTTLDVIHFAIQGEFSYTIDQPLQLSEVELLRGLFASAGVPGVPPPSPGTPTVDPGEFYSGAVLKDVTTGQMTLTYVGEPGQVVGGLLGASQLIFLMEMGFVRVLNFDDPAYRPLQGAVTPQNVLTGNTATQLTSFGTKTSWGYVIRAALPYNNLVWGMNVTPFIGWRQDFNGVTPFPLGNFIEGRKGINFGVRFNYLNAWSSEIGYANFFGGGIDNPRNDRDFFSFDIKYSF